MIDYYPRLIPGNYYHIFNRANGNDKLFRWNKSCCNEKNFQFSQKK